MYQTTYFEKNICEEADLKSMALNVETGYKRYLQDYAEVI